jgi:hypothetical protein
VSNISIVPVDERDSGWEDPRPRFRVYLHGSGETETHGWTATYDITGADILQVIDWAQAQATGTRTYAIALVYDDKANEATSPGYGRGLVWLVGGDGNDNTRDDPARRVIQQRMLDRRAAPTMVASSDKMPDGHLTVHADEFAEWDRAQPPSRDES